MATVLCVLYDDPKQPNSTAKRASLPDITQYPDGQSLPCPKNIDFVPGDLLGHLGGGLGLKSFLAEQNHTFIVTADKDGEDSEFERALPDADIVISQPFWPAYLDARRLDKAKKLGLIITAGIGSDHIDITHALRKNITITEVTYSNSISVAEHAVMLMLSLVRNYLPSHQTVLDGGWNIADCVQQSYDIEGMTIGSLGAGRIGLAVMKRLQGFDVKLHYTDKHRLPKAVEQALNLTYHANLNQMAPLCDILTINVPLHPETKHLINKEFIQTLKKGTYIVNTARAQICDEKAIVDACNTGHLAGYAGDVWYPQPAPIDHPWRYMKNHGMTPHIAGTSLSAQARYAAGTREILECWFDNRPIRESYLIGANGQLKGAGARAYTVENA
ncbi:MAG: formate dehydrogenase [Legionellaceae bacterium]|nr:formate dehydrogenase [Legionellaceae bacterium]HCA89386.1 NAD-dependent formate dehydrogenase [Legionellales bacterium]|tara:strand:- start:602 stop:1762 length:1161 start_codon:yes stop_codon:yes gene_type:complete